MEIRIYNQQDPKWKEQELGVGRGYTIGRYGCATTCLSSLAVYYGRDTDPGRLNLELVTKNGFASNGTTNSDGSVNKTLLVWGSLAAVYGELRLEKNIAYPTTPADMSIIDSYLTHGMPVVVGVSFLHNSKDTVPSHYVLLYSKNQDGTYQCMDPWFGDSVVFDKRYAVNGMSVANAILQVVCYAGPVPSQPAQQAPIAAHPQQAVTPEDVAKNHADTNYNLYLQEVELARQKDDRITVLEQDKQALLDANRKLTVEIADTKTLNATLASHLSDLEAEDSAAIEEGLKATEQLKEKEEIVQNTANFLGVKATLRDIIGEIDSLLSKISFTKKENPKKDVLSLLGIKGEVSK